MKCPCGKEFKTYPSKVKIGRGKYCSKKCMYENRVSGGLFEEGHNKWDHPNCKKNWFKNTGGSIDEKGYRRIHVGNGRWKREHVLAMEERLGRELRGDEMVHHINEDRCDNRLENLVLFRMRVAHTRLHKFAKRHGLNMKIYDFKRR